MTRRTLAAISALLLALAATGAGEARGTGDYDHQGVTRIWGSTDYRGEPWVRNVSRDMRPRRGLAGRHMTVYASHGKYFDQTEAVWKWQRPLLNGTREDWFTPSIVTPLLIPMLENAGATVYTPRERDPQPLETIVDNDAGEAHSGYTEYSEADSPWLTCPGRGFGWHSGPYSDGENPFLAGTARMARATRSTRRVSIAAYTPRIAQEGPYAVYASYQTLPESVDDAEYIVCHKGVETRLRVNQRMGGGTWVYLGTYDFDRGENEYNRVVVTNHSRRRGGVVSTDAIRLGGGTGNIMRGGMLSDTTRYAEGARYAAQWAGAPYSVYSSKGGLDDYADDINVRPMMTSWLAGGSVYMPAAEGKGVPLELSVAVHSDAGYDPEGREITGSLAICTTHTAGGRLATGVPRAASRLLAESMTREIGRDLRHYYGRWTLRGIWDKNYAETRRPEVPSIIIETLSHESGVDMGYGLDSLFRFRLARAMYKAILRYTAVQHGRRYSVQPLPVTGVRTERGRDGRITLTWQPQADPLEPTATPTYYRVYTAAGTAGYDDGTVVKKPAYTLRTEPGVAYRFRVAAGNEGGESLAVE